MRNSTRQRADASPSTPDESTVKEFFDAAAVDDLRALKICAKKKRVPLTSRDRDNSTAAHVAAKNGKYLTLRYLLTRCPSLLNETDAFGKTVLHRAVATDQPKIVKLLFEKHNADLNVRCSSPSGNTVVHEAAEVGAIRVLQYLHKARKADLEVRNGRGESPIFLAVANNRERVLRYLVDWGNVDPTAKDEDGNNIVFSLVCTGSIKMLVYLRNKGVYYDVNARNERGECALHRAVQCDRLDFVRHLVDVRGADVDVADKKGRTPLYEAARMGRADIVKYLVSKGANVNHWSADGTRPADVATDTRVVECLRPQATEQRVRRGAAWSVDRPTAHVRSDIMESPYRPALSSAVDRTPFPSIASAQVNSFLTLANTYIRYMFRT